MATRSSFSRRNRTRGLSLIAGTSLLIAGFLWGGDLIANAQPETTGASLAQQYLAALKPAGTSISTIEAKLKALPTTASVSRVKAIVAPLSKSLDPLENLIQSSGSSPIGTSLQSLGEPIIQKGYEGVACNKYSTPASGGHLVVAGTEYQDGFQMSTPSISSCNDMHAGYTWKIGNKYSTFKLQVGYDISDTASQETMRFLGDDNEYLPFTFNDRVTDTMSIPAKGLTSVSVNVSQQTQLTVEVVYSSYGSSVVDVVNDQLS